MTLYTPSWDRRRLSYTRNTISAQNLRIQWSWLSKSWYWCSLHKMFHCTESMIKSIPPDTSKDVTVCIIKIVILRYIYLSLKYQCSYSCYVYTQCESLYLRIVWSKGCIFQPDLFANMDINNNASHNLASVLLTSASKWMNHAMWH